MDRHAPSHPARFLSVRAHVTRFARAALATALLAGAASAQEVTLRLHHFLNATSTIPAGFLEPWAERIERESGGRIRIDIFPSMQLGGAPASLFDQARTGVVDIVWTLPGYTPGRFPRSEVLELPFLAHDAERSSAAAHAFFERHLQGEFEDVRVLAFHVHSPGLLHVRGRPVRALEDLRGRTIRAPTRAMNDFLAALGAEPVGMPASAVPEAVARGVIDGALLPWEVTTSMRLAELVDAHTYVAGTPGLYTSTFVLAMNRASYDRLPDDLREVLDRHSGVDAARWAGRVMDEGDEAGLEAARRAGNAFVELEPAERARWEERAERVLERWLASAAERGFDGAVLWEDARAAMRDAAGDPDP